MILYVCILYNGEQTFTLEALFWKPSVTNMYSDHSCSSLGLLHVSITGQACAKDFQKTGLSRSCSPWTKVKVVDGATQLQSAAKHFPVNLNLANWTHQNSNFVKVFFFFFSKVFWKYWNVNFLFNVTRLFSVTEKGL